MALPQSSRAMHMGLPQSSQPIHIGLPQSSRAIHMGLYSSVASCLISDKLNGSVPQFPYLKIRVVPTWYSSDDWVYKSHACEEGENHREQDVGPTGNIVQAPKGACHP